MAQALYKVDTGAAFFNSLASPALQTALTVTTSSTQHGLQLKKYRLGFNGTNAATAPVIVRIFTKDATGAGTSTSATANLSQVAGRTIALTGVTAGMNYTVEPSTKTYVDEISITPDGGTVVYDYPWGDEPDYFNSGSTTFGIEITPTAQVGVTAALWFTRI